VIRLLISAPLGLGLAAVFFVLLAEMVQMDQIRSMPEQNDTALNLVPLPEESELSLRQRDKPEPPEIEPEQPAMPSMPTPIPAVSANTDAIQLDVDIPQVQVDSNFQLDVDLSQFQPSEPVLNIPTTPSPEATAAFDMVEPQSRVNPRYPAKAVRRGIEGKVVVEFTVSPAGEVVKDSIRIIESKPKGVFDRTSLRALTRWRYQPKIVSGQAVAFPTRQTLVFKLEK